MLLDARIMSLDGLNRRPVSTQKGVFCDPVCFLAACPQEGDAEFAFCKEHGPTVGVRRAAHGA